MLKELAQLLDKPEYRHIMVACDETYHELVYGANRVCLKNKLHSNLCRSSSWMWLLIPSKKEHLLSVVCRSALAETLVFALDFYMRLTLSRMMAQHSP